MKKYLIYYFLFLSFSVFSFCSENNVTSENDSVKIERFKRHVNSLRYISRQTLNNEFFLNLSLKYVDSIKKYDNDNRFAVEAEKSLLLTKRAISNDVISKIEFFDFYSGVPEYLGFIDPPIEYAFDHALSKLLESRYKVLGNAPLSDYRINSIIIRENCDEETFEIINQTITSNTNHFIISNEMLNDFLGYEDAKNLINGSFEENILKKLMMSLNLDRLGIFTVNNLDVIENKIWLANTDFKTYEFGEGFFPSIFTRGFSVDKTNLPLFFDLILALLLAIVFVSFAYGVSLIFVNRKNIFHSSKDSNKELIMSVVDKVKYLTLYFLAPIILSFLMIYLSSYIIPRGDTDIGEISFKLWIVSLTILMSFLPIVFNLFIVNRLNIDGFHTTIGYTFFANSCLYATYFPIFVFYFVQYETYPFLINILLIFITLVIGNLLGKSYYQYGVKTKNTYKRSQAVVGLILGLVAIIIFNRIIIFELSVQNLLLSFIIIAPISILNNVLDNYLERIFEKKSKISAESSILDEIPYIKSVMNPYDSIYKSVEKNMSNDLNIMLIDGPMGIGKTRSINEARAEHFTKKNGWRHFYGDCDEVQDENATSFEPFLQAFSELIGDDWNSRTESTDKITKGLINIASDKAGIPLELSDFNNSSEKTMNEISLEIIDKLTKINKKILFVMEDVHWIDPETLTLLRHFIKTVNRNTFLRKNLCIIITVRTELKGSYRGLSFEELKIELNNLNDETNNSFDIVELLHSNSFNLVDFVKNLSIEKNKFKIASSSMNQINNLFNQYNEQLKSESKDDKLTPLYVFKVLESWISDENLKYTADGYILTKTVDIESLPNFEDVDSYYHKIFESFEPKWRRILESASVIGNKFDADILAQVWGYELLDVLDFLEMAVNKDLLIDVSSQDNFYEFKDKRIVSALKSYFKDASIRSDGEKQIVIEYNKRYLELQSDIIKNPERYDTEDLLKVIRRMLTLSSIEYYSNKCNKLILDVVCRYLYSKKLGKLDAFANLLEKKSFNELADLVKKLRIIADDVNFSFSQKKKILDDLANEEKRKSKIPLPSGINTDQLSNDLGLLIILNGELMNTNSDSIVTTTVVGFNDDKFHSFIPTLNLFPSKLNGLSLIYFIKELGDINLSLDDEVELIISGGYEEKQKQIEEGQKVMFQHTLNELKNTKFHQIALKEYRLWEIEKASRNMNDSKDKIAEIFNKYKSLINSVENSNSKFFYDCINSYLNFCHTNYNDGLKSNEVFKLYNNKLKVDGQTNEAWVLTFIKFILSTCTVSKKESNNNLKIKKDFFGYGAVRPGRLYIEKNPEDAEQNFNDTKNFLDKILDSGSVTKASMWFLDAKKLHYDVKKDFKNYKNSQLDYLNKLKKDFGEESMEFNKASINIANDLEWQTEYNPNCPNFFNDCILIWKKSLDNILSQRKDFKDIDNEMKQFLGSSFTIGHFELAKRYQKLSNLYIKQNSLKNASECTLSALDLYNKNFEIEVPNNWDFINDELVPISKDTKELFFEESGDERYIIISYGKCILNYARCLSMQKKYGEAITIIDKASSYCYVFPKIYNLSQVEKGINLILNKSNTGKKLIKDSLLNLEKLNIQFKKSEIELIQQANKLINK